MIGQSLEAILSSLSIEDRVAVLGTMSRFMFDVGFAKNGSDLAWQQQFTRYRDSLPEHLREPFFSGFTAYVANGIKGEAS